MEAEASTDSNIRPGFVPRQKPGLAVFGKSSNTPPIHPVRLQHCGLLAIVFSCCDPVCVCTSIATCGDHKVAASKCAVSSRHNIAVLHFSSDLSWVRMQNMRVDFQFDKAAFAFNALPFKIPYPVPFKLLGDETKVLTAGVLAEVPFHACNISHIHTV